MIRKIYSGGLRFNDVSDVSRNKFQRSLQELVVGKRKRVERLTTGGGKDSGGGCPLFCVIFAVTEFDPGLLSI